MQVNVINSFTLYFHKFISQELDIVDIVNQTTIYNPLMILGNRGETLCTAWICRPRPTIPHFTHLNSIHWLLIQIDFALDSSLFSSDFNFSHAHAWLHLAFCYTCIFYICHKPTTPSFYFHIHFSTSHTLRATLITYHNYIRARHKIGLPYMISIGKRSMSIWKIVWPSTLQFYILSNFRTSQEHAKLKFTLKER